MQPSEPTVSIITAVRNGLPFVEETIESVLSQTYPAIEYIVVDGGSTDGTLDVVRRNGARIAHWISEPDRGISDAFNKGLRLASGDYLMFLNADDWLASPDAITLLVEAARARNCPQVIYGDCDLYDRDTRSFLYRASIPYERAALLGGAALPHPGLLTHRDYFNLHGEFDESFRIAMDYEFFLRGVPQTGAHHVPGLVTNVRGGGISTRDENRVVNEIIAALKKNGYIRSTWAECRMRGYYLSRSFARSLLGTLGLYEAFSRIRNQRQNKS